MTLVLDASVIVKWVFSEADSAAAVALIDLDRLTAPSLWQVEAANALWSRTRRGELSSAEAGERLGRLRDAPILTTPLEEDMPAALQLAAKLGHPVYDCVYLASAIRQNLTVVTADQRFAKVVEASDLASRVRLLGA